MLERNPLIGRSVRTDLGELVIGRRARGYVAPYRYVAELDTVFALAIRGQKETGYTRNCTPNHSADYFEDDVAGTCVIWITICKKMSLSGTGMPARILNRD